MAKTKSTKPVEPQRCAQCHQIGCDGTSAVPGHQPHCRDSRCKKARGEPRDVMRKTGWAVPATLYGRVAAYAERMGKAQAEVAREFIEAGLKRENA